jgi:GcrA cell cycle regulator
MAIDWTPQIISALIAYWDEGIPTSEIGRRLGVTKNAVVGKVHRLGLTKRRSPIQQKVAAPQKLKKKAPMVSMDDLKADMCWWPEGEPGTEGFGFCGVPAVPDKPYCAAHCEKAYVKIKSARERRAA